MVDARPLAGLTVAAMMLASFAAALSGANLFAGLAGAFAWATGLLLAPHLNRFQRGQSGAMFAIGTACVVYATWHGDWSWWNTVRLGNHSLLAMLAAVTFLRLITKTGDDGQPLPRGPRAVLQTLAATHVFGAVINISAPVLIGERIAQRGKLTPLQTKVVSRAFVAASMWSPFFIAMALILQVLPHAQFTVIAGAGFIASSCLLAYCAWRLPRSPEVADFIGYPLRANALWPPVLLSSCVLGGHALWPALPILPLIQGAALGMVALILPWQQGTAALTAVTAHVRERLPGMGGEIATFLSSSVMSAGIDAAVRQSHLQLAPTDLHAGGASILLAVLIVLALVGVHPVASLTVLAGVWSLPSLDGNLVGMVFLLVWGLGLVASPFSGTSFVFQARFGLRAFDLLRWNGGYLLGGCVLGVAMLYGYEALWRH